MTIVTPKFGMGASVLRLEDQRFITGKGRYTDDISLAGTLHGYVLRSPVAKARISLGSVEAARAAPGVHLVLTGAVARDVEAGPGVSAGPRWCGGGPWPAQRCACIRTPV